MATTKVYDTALVTANVATRIAGLRVARYIVLALGLGLALCLGLA